MEISIFNQNLILLLLTSGFGNRLVKKIAESRKDIISERFLSLNDISDLLTPKQIESYTKSLKYNLSRLEDVSKSCWQSKASIANCYDLCYPQALKEISDSPVIIFYKGDLSYDYSRSLAIVGARKYTLEGKEVCESFVNDLASFQINVVSGLAFGIDAIAHHKATSLGLKCIGVVGHGIDFVYPVSNAGLYERVLEAGGVILTDFLPGTMPSQYTFPKRNRIIAGLSRGTLVVEAAKDSGSLITARLSFDVGREVYAVPGALKSVASEGCNEIIKSGIAKLVTSGVDIAEDFGLVNAQSVEQQRKQSVLLPAPPGLDDVSVKVLERISIGSFDSDDLSLVLGMDIISLNSVLTDLEVLGLIYRNGAMKWVMC